jgi:hypothetical protein
MANGKSQNAKVKTEVIPGCAARAERQNPLVSRRYGDDEPVLPFDFCLLTFAICLLTFAFSLSFLPIFRLSPSRRQSRSAPAR